MLNLPGLSLGLGSGPSAAAADTGDLSTTGTVKFGGARKESLSTGTALVVAGFLIAGAVVYARTRKS